MTQRAGMPTQVNLMWPTLRALEKLGGSAAIRELDDRVSIDLDLEDATLEVPHGDGPRTAFAYRCAWARTRLRRVGAVDTSGSGVWTITNQGRQVRSAEELLALNRREQEEYRRGQAGDSSDANDTGDELLAKESWQGDLIEILRELKPQAFERLCQYLLREHGFTRVEVTGRSGDGGIDGTGVLKLNLFSFHVSYQCKRYSGKVGPGSIRDFRGAVAGRADKGLFITTGKFTKEAEREAVRDGAMRIDLIDGEELCGLMRDKKLGVVTETVTRVMPDFFHKL